MADKDKTKNISKEEAQDDELKINLDNSDNVKQSNQSRIDKLKTAVKEELATQKKQNRGAVNTDNLVDALENKKVVLYAQKNKQGETEINYIIPKENAYEQKLNTQLNRVEGKYLGAVNQDLKRSVNLERLEESTKKNKALKYDDLVPGNMTGISNDLGVKLYAKANVESNNLLENKINAEVRRKVFNQESIKDLENSQENGSKISINRDKEIPLEQNPKQFNQALVDNALTRNIITSKIENNKRVYKVNDKPELENALNNIPAVKADAIVQKHNKFSKYKATKNLNKGGVSFQKIIESKVSENDQASNIQKPDVKERKDIQLGEKGIKPAELSKALKENKVVTIKGEGKEFKFESNKISVTQQQMNQNKTPAAALKTTVAKQTNKNTANRLTDKFMNKPMDDNQFNKVLVENAKSGKYIGRSVVDEKIKYEVKDQPEATKRLNNLPSDRADDIFQKNNNHVKEALINKNNQAFTPKAISFKENISPKLSLSNQMER